MPVFVDSNVLVYARDRSDGAKHERAREWMNALWRRRAGRISMQVLHEFYVTATRKLDPGLPVDEARRDVVDLTQWGPLALDHHLVEAAWQVEDQHRLSFWDALIVAAALRTSSEHLLTDDLNDGQEFGTTRVLDPFRHEPEEILG